MMFRDWNMISTGKNNPSLFSWISLLVLAAWIFLNVSPLIWHWVRIFMEFEKNEFSWNQSFCKRFRFIIQVSCLNYCQIQPIPASFFQKIQEMNLDWVEYSGISNLEWASIFRKFQLYLAIWVNMTALGSGLNNQMVTQSYLRRS